jgi:proteic killer suppression protein
MLLGFRARTSTTHTRPSSSALSITPIVDSLLASALDNCIVTRYTCREVIRSFKHAGLEKFFTTGSKAGIQPAHARRLEDQLVVLNRATSPIAMNSPGWNLHQLQGNLDGHWSVKVNGNWRMTFRFEGEGAILVDYRDYH